MRDSERKEEVNERESCGKWSHKNTTRNESESEENSLRSFMDHVKDFFFFFVLDPNKEKPEEHKITGTNLMGFYDLNHI